MSFTYSYARPALAVDCIVFALDLGKLKVLLIQRRSEPFANHWALPGGFLEIGETLEAAARRELAEETGLKHVFLEQLYTFSHLNRDPRDRVISVGYFALVRLNDHRVRAATDARCAAWFPMDDVPRLAFDHDKILKMAYQRLRGKVRYQPIGFELLPSKFTLRQLQQLYETLLDRSFDKRNFRKKFLGMGVLVELDEMETEVAHRAARLYQFDQKKYKRLVRQGFHFEI